MPGTDLKNKLDISGYLFEKPTFFLRNYICVGEKLICPIALCVNYGSMTMYSWARMWPQFLRLYGEVSEVTLRIK